ncbi:TPA: H(+)-transporting V0 sector ATPase subunit a [Trebouxia sp. C0006]
MRDVEGERLAVTFKLRSPDTTLLDFHMALTAAGKQFEPRFAGPIRVIELLAMFDEMHPSINNAACKQRDKRERALTVKGNASESQSEMNDQHAPKRTAKHSQVPDAAELIRRHEAEQEHSPDMCLSVHTLTQRTIRVNVHNSWDIGAVKSLIGIVMTGVPPDAMRLVNAGRQLQDKYLLSDYDIGDEANLHLVLKLGED